MRFEYNIYGVTEQIVDYGNVDIIPKTLDMQPEEPSEDKLTNIKEETDCGEKNEDAQEEVMPGVKNPSILKEILETFSDIKSIENKMLKVDSNLERTMMAACDGSCL